MKGKAQKPIANRIDVMKDFLCLILISGSIHDNIE
jgi:hypothetical protein